MMRNRIRRLVVVSSTFVLVACGGGSSPATGSLAPGDDGSLARVKAAGVFNSCAVDGLLPTSSSDPAKPGFDLQIAGRLAQLMGVKNHTVWVGTWDGLIPSLTSKQCDAIVDSMFITDARRKVVDFAGPYYSGGEVILVPKGNTTIHTIDDLKKLRRVGVLQGSVTVDYLKGKGLTNLKIYPDQNTVILDLSNGGSDAAYLEAESAGWALKQNPSLNVQTVADYVPDTRYNYGIPVRKEDQALLRALNDGIARLAASGELQTLMAQYGTPYFAPI